MQIVIHITGASGSGKSTLGDYFASDCRFAVKDTDEFIQRGNAAHEELMSLSKEYPFPSQSYLARWKEIWDTSICAFIANHPGKIIVFVGLTDHFGYKEYHTITQATHRFLLKISSAQLVKQYYTRVFKRAQQNELLWEEIANGEHHVDGSSQVLMFEKEVREHHKNYVVATRDEIITAVARLFASDE